jgi:hypothetical protein
LKNMVPAGALFWTERVFVFTLAFTLLYLTWICPFRRRAYLCLFPPLCLTFLRVMALFRQYDAQGDTVFT